MNNDNASVTSNFVIPAKAEPQFSGFRRDGGNL